VSVKEGQSISIFDAEPEVKDDKKAKRADKPAKTSDKKAKEEAK
jgi:hypothetical protein